MKISLEHNNGPNHELVPYVVYAEMSSYKSPAKTSFNVPIHLQHIRDRSAYRADLCGISIEAKTPDKILKKIKRLLPGLMCDRQLPTYVFIARHARRIYPVYTAGDEVFATTAGGPIFRHVELAKVREYVTDYLHATGELWVPGDRDRLHVRGVNNHTLQVILPLFYLKKRAQSKTDNEFWAPVFPSENESQIYAYAASSKRDASVTSGKEVFELHRLVTQALIADKRLQRGEDLRIDRLYPWHWDHIKTNLKPYPGRLLCNGDTLEMYQYNDTLLAIEYRRRENRYSFFMGSDAEELRVRAAQDFVRREIIDAPSAVALDA